MPPFLLWQRRAGSSIWCPVRATVVVLGVLLILLGLVWIGQGLGYVRGSFMTGALLWAWIGAGTALVGAALVCLAVIPRRHSSG